MSTPKYIIKTCLLFKTRTCNWPKLNRILKTKILPFKLCPICIVLEAESVIEPLRVLVSNAVLFSSKPSTKKLISVWCTCKNYHCHQVHKLLLVLTSCQQPSCLFSKLFYSFLTSFRWKYWEQFILIAKQYLCMLHIQIWIYTVKCLCCDDVFQGTDGTIVYVPYGYPGICF